MSARPEDPRHRIVELEQRLERSSALAAELELLLRVGRGAAGFVRRRTVARRALLGALGLLAVTGAVLFYVAWDASELQIQQASAEERCAQRERASTSARAELAELQRKIASLRALAAASRPATRPAAGANTVSKSFALMKRLAGDAGPRLQGLAYATVAACKVGDETSASAWMIALSHERESASTRPASIPAERPPSEDARLRDLGPARRLMGYAAMFCNAAGMSPFKLLRVRGERDRP